MNNMKKIVAALSILGVAAMALPGHAVTIEELMAQIAELQAQLVKLQAQAGVTVTGGCTFTRALYVGVRGDDVKCLQEYLMGAGYSIPAGPTNYYGAQTQAAVAQWQAANGVAPAAGYFGSISQAKYNSLKPSTPGTETPGQPETPGTDTGEGTEGYLEVKVLTVPNDTDVHDGEENVEVMAFDLKAKDSDITVRRIDLQFKARVDKDLSYISLYSGSNAITGVKTSSYTKVGTDYRYRIDGLNLKIAKGTTETVTVKVSVLANPKSSDETSYTLSIVKDAIRYTDSLGINHYNGETETGDSLITLKGEETAALKVSLNSGSPDEGIVTVDKKSVTKDIELLVFDVQSKDVTSTLDKVVVTINASDSSKNISDIISAVRLYSGKTLIGTERPAKVKSTTSVTFDEIDGVSLGKDVKKTLRVEVDIYGSDNYAEGTYISAAIAAGAVYVTDANDNEPTSSGVATGKDMYLYATAPVISGIQPTITPVEDKDGSFTARMKGTISFTLTVEGDDEILIPTNGIVIKGFTLSKTGTVTTSAAMIEINGDPITTLDDNSRIFASGDNVKIVANAEIKQSDVEGDDQYVYFQIESITWKVNNTDKSMAPEELKRTKTDSKLFIVNPK